MILGRLNDDLPSLLLLMAFLEVPIELLKDREV